jgi:hypothetical protein
LVLEGEKGRERSKKEGWTGDEESGDEGSGEGAKLWSKK